MNTIPHLVIGTFQNRNYKELYNVVNAAVSSGFNGFDTAPSYGTETQLGRAIKEVAKLHQLERTDFFIIDKVDAWQMMDGNVEKYVADAIEKMKVDYFDLLLIHWPIQEYLSHTWDCLKKLKKEGIVKEIGICNVRVRHLKEAAAKGITPNVIQIERHPLRTCDAEMAYCKEHDIKVLSYSPLCRMHPNIRNNSLLKSIASKYNKNVGQLVLRWQIDTGCIPVFMSKKPSRITENSQINDFHLDETEVNTINGLNQNYKIFLESWGCPGF